MCCIGVVNIEWSVCLQGELQARGGITTVSDKIKQEELPSSILDQIMTEVDTDDRYTRLMTQLEDCVAFLTFFLSSTSRMNGDTKLSTFIVDAMLVAPEVWREVSCATIDREVLLKHLKSLLTGMDERQNGAFHSLDDKYRKPLSAQGVEALKQFLKKAGDMSLLLETMKDLMLLFVSPMATAATLKENLIAREMDLADCDWFVEYFPSEQVPIECMLEAYKVLK